MPVSKNVRKNAKKATRNLGIRRMAERQSGIQKIFDLLNRANPKIDNSNDTVLRTLLAIGL
ncbi:Phage protein [Escherichia phage T5_ev219]|uniref:Phage protein n=1 Tax=Escherichia phage T5_ev219 TaxID=2742947 RepID=A0A653FZ69_9CAUD|nr:Phage protein [Escherichia phage T5_ev219]